MRTQANERGIIESGFRRAEDGWHIAKFLEGIDYLKKKNSDGDEVIVSNKSGDKNWKIPLVIDDADDASHEVTVDQIVAENKKGEQVVSDFLGATGLFDAFAKAFPGDVSVFEDKVMAKVKTKLPGQYIRIKTKQNEYTDKNKEKQIAVNIVAFGKMSDSLDDLKKLFSDEKEKPASSGSSKKDKKEAATATKGPDDDF